MTNEIDERRKAAEIHYRRHSDYDCTNQFTMAGPADDVTAVMDLLASGYSDFTFNNVKPVPDELKTFNPLNIKPSVLEKYKALDAYSYRDEHWSTSKEPKEVQYETMDLSPESQNKFSKQVKDRITIQKVASYKFKTCMTPPSGIYFELSKKFPTILFHYTFDIDSEAESTCGWALGMAGKILNRGQYDESFSKIKLHLGGFSELWLDQLDEDTDNDEE